MAYELAFVLSGESDDLEAALQRSAAGVEDLEAAAKGLTSTQLRWNDATGQFIDQQGNFVSQLTAGKQLREELNSLGIRTTAQIEEEIQALNLLEKAYQDDAQAVAQLAGRKEALENQLRRTAEGAEQTATGFRSTSRATSNANQVMFTAGDALQDVSVAFQQSTSTSQAFGNAARFAGNNVAFGAEQVALLVSQTGSLTAAMRTLTASMLGVGGIIVAVQTLVALGPTIVDFFSDWVGGAEDAEDATERLATATADLTDVARANRTVFDQLQDDPQRLAQALEVLDQAMSANRAEMAAGDYGQLTAEFRALRLVVERLKGDTDDTVAQFEALRQLGIPAEVADQLVRIANAAERTPGPLEEATEKQKELREELGLLQGADGQRLMKIERQNEALQQQIDWVRRLARLQAEGPQRVEGIEGPSLEEMTRQRLQDQARLRSLTRNLPGAGGAAAEAAQGINQFADANQNLKETLIQLDQPMEQLFASLPALAAGTQDIASVAGGILGTFAQQVGRTMIAFGLTGEAIKNFTTNPWTAVIAGGSLIALGSLLKQRVQSQADSFTSGAGFSQGGFGAPIQNSGSGSRLSDQALVGAGSRPSFGGPASGASGRQGPQVVTLRHEHTFSNFQLRGQDLLASVERTATIRESGRPTMRQIQLD